VPTWTKLRKKIIQGVIVVLLLSIIMSWSTNNPQRLQTLNDLGARALYPFQYAASYVARVAVDSWQFVLDVRNVYLDNQDYKDLLDQYSGIELQLIEIRQENSRLRDLLEFKDEVEFEVTPAQVIGRNPSTWFSDMVIGKGSDDGVEVDMPIVTNQGLVGKIVSVSPSYSKVQLLISPDSGISAIVQRTRDNGVLIGVSNPSGYTMITRLDQKSDIRQGDVIISSPLTGIFPKGIVIGRVVEVYQDPVSLETSALVKPEVDFDRLEEVLIILNYVDQVDEPDEGDTIDGEEETEEQDGEEE